jgi:hypothetical protein
MSGASNPVVSEATGGGSSLASALANIATGNTAASIEEFTGNTGGSFDEFTEKLHVFTWVDKNGHPIGYFIFSYSLFPHQQSSENFVDDLSLVVTGVQLPVGSVVALTNDIGQNYDYLTSLLNGNLNFVIKPGVADTDIEVGSGGTATIVDNAEASLYVWHQKNIVWENAGPANENVLFFQPFEGLVPKAPNELVLDLLTGAGQNPFGGTLQVSNVDNVNVGNINGEYIIANNDGDTINGNGGFDAGNALIIGGKGSDTLKGLAPEAFLATTNVLIAGTGTSTLEGGQTVLGGTVSNIFVYDLGVVTIENFRAGSGSGDTIDLSAVPSIHSFSDVQALMSQSGTDTVINFGNGHTIRLDNVTDTNLTAGNFLFQPEAAYVSAPNGSAFAGQTVHLTFAMTGIVTVNTTAGSPTLTLSNGATATYDAAASNPSGYILVFDYTVGSSDTPTNLAVTSVNLNGATITDANGHNANFTPTLNQPTGLEIDPATVTAVQPSQGGEVDNGQLQLTLTLSESITVNTSGGSPKLTLSNGATATFDHATGDHLVFDYAVGANDHSPNLQIASINLNGATVTDAHGLTPDFANALNTDTNVQIGPALYVASLDNSLSSSVLGLTEVHSGQTIQLYLQMNEPVTLSGGTPSLTLSDGATTTYDASASSPTAGFLAFDYTVGAGDHSPDLKVTGVSNAATVTDGNGHAANFGAALNVPTLLQIGSSPLTVTSVQASPTGQAADGELVHITLTLSEAVTISGTPNLIFNDNYNDPAVYDSGASNPGGGILVFNEFIDAVDFKTGNLEIAGLANNGASIEDANGYNLDLTAAINKPLGVSVGEVVTPLLVQSVTTNAASAEMVAGQTLQITLVMSEGSLTVNTSGGSPTLTLDDGATATYDAAASNLASGTLVFDYTIGASDRDQALWIRTANLNGATITDASSNAADLTNADHQLIGVQIGPAYVNEVSTSQIGTYTSGQTVQIALNMIEAVTVNTSGGSPTLTLNNGATATYDPSASGTGVLIFDYTVGSSDATPDLEISNINLNGATVTDLFGHNADLSGALNTPTYLQIGSGLQSSSPLTTTQINDLYESVLQRGPSNAEVTTATALATTVGAAGTIASVVDSPEAQHNVYPIAQIIELATGNMPVTAQFAGWVPFIESNGLLQGELQTNPLLDQMAEAFVASTQFGNTYNGGTAVDPNATVTSSIVSAIIQAATGVAATQTQTDAWVNTGQTIDQVFVDFALGDQYSAHIQSAVQQYLTTAADTAVGGGGLGVVNTTPNDHLTATQVQGAYHAVLQRAPSSAETNAALSLDSSIGNVAAVAAIVDSPEAHQYVYPITQIILLATGNLPDPAQLAGWILAVESGTSLDQMALAFVASTAFGNTYNGGTAVDPNAPITGSIVSAVIQAATGVAAAQAQIDAWVNTGLTVDQVFVDFALGDQYSAHIQSTVQGYLDAAAINAAGLTTVDGINATGALTLGTSATPLTGNNLTVLGGSGSLTVVASGNDDTITELSTSTAGGTITASGSNDTVTLADGANTITLTGNLTGATTQNGTTTSGIAMTTLDNVVNAPSDQIIFNNATAEKLAATSAMNVTGAGSSLAKALDIAASDAAASQAGGQIAAHTGVIAWFQLGGNTYIVEAINSTASAAAHASLAATDEVIKIVGQIDLSGESLTGHTLTL